MVSAARPVLKASVRVGNKKGNGDPRHEVRSDEDSSTDIEVVLRHVGYHHQYEIKP